jgi:hypothetical protein
MKTKQRLRPRARTLALLTAVAALTCLAFAGSAMAKAPSGDFAPFGQCPRFTAGVELCLYSQTTGGEVSIGKTAVPIKHTITLQGGIAFSEEPFVEHFVGALNGETLSKSAQSVPGGLAGLVDCTKITNLLERLACQATFENGLTGVQATTELALPPSQIQISTENLENGEGVALSLPVKVHLENPLLGSSCYVGSSSSPIVLNLTTGATSPPPPNASIHGKVGEIRAKDEFEFIEVVGNELVDNAFAVPKASGCGGILSLLIDPIIDAKLGLPSEAGHNTAIQKNTIEEATTVGVIVSEK